MVKLFWTKLSKDDLQEIYYYIADDSIKFAKITVDKIFLISQKIIDNPNLGRIVPEIGNKTIRELIMGRYRIIYRIVNSGKVDILRVYHSARLLSLQKLE